MVTNLLTFATWRYERSRQRLLSSARRFGDFRFWNYSGRDFRLTGVYARHPEVARTPRGAGLWLWKPYYLMQVLNEMRSGERVLYLDAGMEITAPLDPLFELSGKGPGICLFTVHGRLNRHWTKRDCFVLMGCDEPDYLDTEQSMSGVIIIRKNPFVMDLVSQWLEYTADVRIVSDLPNTCGLPDYPGFVEHRHDQSILSNLRIRYGIPSYTDPTQYGGSHRSKARPGMDDYPALLNLHRERLPSLRTALKLLASDRTRFARGVRVYACRMIRSFLRGGTVSRV